MAFGASPCPAPLLLQINVVQGSTSPEYAYYGGWVHGMTSMDHRTCPTWPLSSAVLSEQWPRTPEEEREISASPEYRVFWGAVGEALVL